MASGLVVRKSWEWRGAGDMGGLIEFNFELNYRIVVELKRVFFADAGDIHYEPVVVQEFHWFVGSLK